MTQSLNSIQILDQQRFAVVIRFMRPTLLLIAVVCFRFFASAPLWAQDSAGEEQGLKPYGTFHGGDIDDISMVNGKLTLKIPLISYPQRGGKLHAGFSLVYHNPEYETFNVELVQDRKPYYWSGTYQYLYELSSYGTAIDLQPDFYPLPSCAVFISGTTSCEQYGVYEPDGVLHQMGQLSSTNWISMDATGYIFNASTNVLTDRDGTRYSGLGVEDSNGNLIAPSSTGWTDSVGRSIPQPWPCGIRAGGSCMTTDYPSACQNQPLPVYSAFLWSPPGVNNGTATFTFCFAQISFQAVPPGCTQNPPPLNTCTFGGSVAINLQTVVLPDGTAWQFQYSTGSTGTGAPTKITYPTGASISYTWGWYAGCMQYNHWWNYGLSALTRTVDANDGTGPHTWTYGTDVPSGSTNSITDPLGNTTAFAITTLPNQSNCSLYDTQDKYYQGSTTNGTLLKTVTTAYGYNADPYAGAVPFPTSINVVPISVTTQFPNGQVKKVVKTYDSGVPMTGGGTGTNAIYGLVTQEQEYDYGNNAPPATPIRTTYTNYLAVSNSNYLNNNLLTLPSSVQVKDSSGTQREYTTYAYDGSSLVPSNICSPTHDTNPPDGAYRGNLTSVSRWLNDSTTSTTNCPISVSNGYLVSYSVLNDTGTVDHSVDACGSSNSDVNHKTTYSYSTTSTCSQSFLGAFPTVVTNALGQATNYCYDLNTGLKTSVTDPNGQSTSYQYDVMLRPTQVTYPLQQVNGTGVHGLTTFTYPSNTEVQMTELMDNNGNNRSSYVVTDGLHRELRHLVTNGETIPYDESDTCYDGAGNVSFKSYSYQSSGPAAGQNCSKSGDSFSYDGLHQVLTTTHSDQSTVVASYSGRAKSVSDEGNGSGATRVQRISQVDGLGRLTSVCEISGNMTVGTGGNQTASACNLDIPGTGFLTTYAYDALDNLTSATQGNLNSRSFVYDSLSLLVQATNPESGTMCYGAVTAGNCQLNGYDANANLITKTDARGIVITSSYDDLNRILGKTYSDGTTPSATFAYDQTSAMGVSLTNTIGRRSSISTAASSSYGPTGSVFSYDSMGRVLNNSQCTPQNCGISMFGMTYARDLLGDLTSFTDAAGVILSSSYNHGTRLTGITSSLSDSTHPGTLYSSVHYNAEGSVLSALMGNSGSNVSETRTYDGRLRLASITDGLIYNVNVPAIGGYAPNGDVLQAVDSVNGTWSYSYDQMNRLCNANHSGTLPQCGVSASYNYSYDRFGNLWSGIGNLSVSFNALNNRIDQLNSHYDAAGNLLSDGATTYAYDAESRVTSEQNTGGTINYSYDADGRRIRKNYNNGGLVDYVYDLAGHTTTMFGAGLSWNRGEIYAGGRHLGTYDNNTTYFTFADWLGTERARSTSTGAPYETCTNNPFGDGLTCAGGTDYSPMHFTGKEHDPETGLDYFGARYDSSQYGRFMTPDWAAKPTSVPYAEFGDPQSLNLYDYVRNNPVSKVDLDGHCYPVCTVLIGGVVGAAAGAGAELFAEWRSGRPIDKIRIESAAKGGLITGMIAGLAGPEAGIVAKVAITATASVIGGAGERSENGEKVLDTKAAGTDALAGVLSVGLEKGAEKLIGVPSFLAKESQSSMKSVFVAKSPLTVEREAAARAALTKGVSTTLDSTTDAGRRVLEQKEQEKHRAPRPCEMAAASESSCSSDPDAP